MVKEKRASFAQQIATGPTGSILRRRSSTLMGGKEKKVHGDMKTSSFGPPRMSVSAMSLLGVVDETERELFMASLDIDYDEDDELIPETHEVIPETHEDMTSKSLFKKTLGIDDDEADDLIISRQTVIPGSHEDVTTAERAAVEDPYNLKFESYFEPDEMRCLALVAHNHMKPAMKEFVLTHKEVLKKFRLTGTNTTITMLKEVFADDPAVQYGPGFSSGPLGGDAELCALMCLEDLGGMFFFMDPLSAHPHQADIDCLVRLANVHNILTCINPCSAHAMSFLLKCALEQGRKDKIPSFFYSLKSPGVEVYKAGQKKALEANKTPAMDRRDSDSAVSIADSD